MTPPQITKRRLTMTEVCTMLGVSRTTAYQALADDVINETPGEHFPLPVVNPVRAHGAEWNLSAVEKWIEKGNAK